MEEEQRRTTHPGGAFEMLGEREPCPEPCAVCELFGPLTPERLARIAREARAAPSLVGRNQHQGARLLEAAS